MKLTRRDLLRLGIVVGGGAVLPAGRRLARADSTSISPFTEPFVDALPIADVKTPGDRFEVSPDPKDCVNPDGTKAIHVGGIHGPTPTPPGTEFFMIHEQAVSHQFHRDLPFNVLWGYDGKIPGPTIIANAGTPQLIRFVNDLVDDGGIGEPITAIHRHGGFQAPEDDGYPLDTFCSGESRDYYYPNPSPTDTPRERFSVNWYHDHAIDITGPNVYRGLSGFYLHRNDLDTGKEPNPLGLPGDPFDIGLVIQDRLFDRNGRLVYDTFDHNGFIGDKFCVNGKVQPFLNVSGRKYRFRILNGSNARVYQLFLSNGAPFLVVGTDSDLLEHAVTVQSVRVAPAERVDVVVDFENAPSETYLVNRLQQTDGRKPDGLVSPGTQLLQFRVGPNADDSTVTVKDGSPLVTFIEHPTDLLKQVKVQRTFELERSEGAWVVNGRFFDENRSDARPKLGAPEIWIFKSGGGWVHPVHVHLSTFFVLSRDGKQPPVLERGKKEVFLVGGDVGQEVRILGKFEGFTGRYVFHCHNIEHEDMRMMAQFDVQP
jgi:FtsP/CotA-like multicopper oxidase with cupredoxin domain